MSKLFALVRVNFTINNISFINIDRGKDPKKAIRNRYLMLFVVFCLLFSIYSFVQFGMEGYLALNIPYVALAQMFIVTSIFIILTNIYHVKDALFTFKDYDLLMSLPISRKIIIASKFINLYLTNLLYTFLFMLPCFVAYVQNVHVNLSFCILYFVTSLVIPLIPIIIASIIGTIITAISSLFKHKNISNYIINIIFVFAVFYLSFTMQNVESIDMANMGQSMVNIFNNYYPLTKMYMGIMQSYNLLSLLYFILIPGVLFGLYILIVNKLYLFIRYHLLSVTTVSDYSIKLYKKRTPLKALYLKELKRYFSSVNYVLNTIIGGIMLVIALFIITFIGGDKLDAILNIPNIDKLMQTCMPLVFGIVCAMSSTTSSSISLEGKNLWIVKNIPVSYMTLFWSKILVNISVLLPIIGLSTIIASIYLKADLIMIISLIVISIIYSFFAAFLGIILNLMAPDFEWQSEIKVIKQSMPSFLSVMIGMSVGIIPFVIINSPSISYIWLVALVIVVIDIILYLFIKTKGQQIFAKL